MFGMCIDGGMDDLAEGVSNLSVPLDSLNTLAIVIVIFPIAEMTYSDKSSIREKGCI